MHAPKHSCLFITKNPGNLRAINFNLFTKDIHILFVAKNFLRRSLTL